MTQSKKVYIRTFGCQMNEYDSAKMADVLAAAEGFEPTADPSQADLILFNTCSVREKAQEKVFADLGRVRALKAAKPHLLIGVGGCVASQEGERSGVGIQTVGALGQAVPLVGVDEQFALHAARAQRRGSYLRPRLPMPWRATRSTRAPPPRTYVPPGTRAYVSRGNHGSTAHAHASSPHPSRGCSRVSR